ncbi:hypothetical protein EC973_004952 [Apophysomyces ossiformis]|uniref:Cytochrome P450 n=1 Tax=Apophysomyces ossiformis TaxID=679940 RepID=A0A8H7EKB4_9FUNG|nr:hypothetical protein EC973_004952 [Apophysomyces ossiformis]
MDSLSRTTCIGLLSAISGIALLAFKYNDRRIFHEHREGCVHRRGSPLVGSIKEILDNKETILDWHVEAFESMDTLSMTFSASGIPFSITTIDPRNIEHVLKTNFEGYVKDPRVRDGTIDLLGHGIFNSDGEQWRWQRKTASHLFSVRNFRDHFTDVFLKEIDVLSSQILDKAAADGTSIDFQNLMYKLTLDSFVLLGFGVSLDTISKKEVPFAISFDNLQQHALDLLLNPFKPLADVAKRILRPREMTFKDHLKAVNDFAYSVIEQRREGLASGKTYQDLLSHFMKANNAKNEPLSDKELRDTILNFTIAGRDTTAAALSWTLYSLLMHPQVEEALLEEIEKYDIGNADDDAPALYEKIKKMNYAHAIFYEALRLYPSVHTNSRYAVKDDIWPDGTHVKSGDFILWFPYVQGRSRKLWGPDASEFRPERWITPEGDLQRVPPWQWSVFHGGPRACLGQQLATLEAVVTITSLLKRYKFSLVPDQKITYHLTLTLPMQNGMQVYVQKR